MKGIVFLFNIVFLLAGCTRDDKSKMNMTYYTKEKNSSSFNIFYQFYLDDGNVYRIKLSKNRESNSNEPYSRYPDRYPYWTYPEDPHKIIKKIVIADLDSQKILKRIEGADIDGLYKLDHFDSYYGDKVRYFVFEITDELLLVHDNVRPRP